MTVKQAIEALGGIPRSELAAYLDSRPELSFVAAHFRLHEPPKCPPDAVIVVCNHGGAGFVEIDVWGDQPSTKSMNVYLNSDDDGPVSPARGAESRPGGRQFSSFPPALQPVSGFYAVAGAETPGKGGIIPGVRRGRRGCGRAPSWRIRRGTSRAGRS